MSTGVVVNDSRRGERAISHGAWRSTAAPYGQPHQQVRPYNRLVIGSLQARGYCAPGRDMISAASAEATAPRAGSHEDDTGGAETWRPRSAEDRRAISVQLARVTRGQSRLLPVLELGWSATSSAVICPIPKLTVRDR